MRRLPSCDVLVRVVAVRKYEPTGPTTMMMVVLIKVCVWLTCALARVCWSNEQQNTNMQTNTQGKINKLAHNSARLVCFRAASSRQRLSFAARFAASSARCCILFAVYIVFAWRRINVARLPALLLLWQCWCQWWRCLLLEIVCATKKKQYVVFVTCFTWWVAGVVGGGGWLGRKRNRYWWGWWDAKKNWKMKKTGKKMFQFDSSKASETRCWTWTGNEKVFNGLLKFGENN